MTIFRGAAVPLLLLTVLVAPCVAQQVPQLQPPTPPKPRDLHYAVLKDRPLTVRAGKGVLNGAIYPNRSVLTAQCHRNSTNACVSGRVDLVRGKLELQPDGAFTYRPNAGAVGRDTFEYTVTAGEGAPSERATVTIDIVLPTESDRSVIDATFFVGEAIDTFSADELHRYLNPQEGSATKYRLVAGIDFEYRIGGLIDNHLPIENGTQIWLFGETVHGVRSGDVNCASQDKPPVCGNLFDPNGAPDRALYILRNASSLEAFTGVRVEFMDVQRGSADLAKLYVKAQTGFLAVDGSGTDVVMNTLVAIGIAAVKGRLAGSYVEIGTGQTQLYYDHPTKRLKIDGHLTWPFGPSDSPISGFAQMTVDAAKGPDSIQTYFGIELDVTRLFGSGSVRRSRR